MRAPPHPPELDTIAVCWTEITLTEQLDSDEYAP